MPVAIEQTDQRTGCLEALGRKRISALRNEKKGGVLPRRSVASVVFRNMTCSNPYETALATGCRFGTSSGNYDDR